jgi:hypothetical protein
MFVQRIFKLTCSNALIVVGHDKRSLCFHIDLLLTICDCWINLGMSRQLVFTIKRGSIL